LRIVAVVFDYPSRGKKYTMLSKVYEYSIKKNCPKAKLDLIKLPPPNLKSGENKSFPSNTVKLDYWYRTLCDSDDKEVIFMDCDMVVLGDLSPAFAYDFDIGYTKRTKCRMPYNGGVVFVKNTQAARDFILLWKEINDRMYNDYRFHKPWRNKYAGMNQAAFGYILEKEKFDAKLRSFPCSVWNSCVEDWQRIDINKTKVVHIKGGLRRAAFNKKPAGPKYRRAYGIWKNLAIEAGVRSGPKTMATEKAPVVISDHPHVKRPPRGTRRRNRRRR